ncbi:hypothetical protein vBVpPvVp04M_00007 [Vibrio phage vB_Vp_PvVp04_M]|nr:hypothetical protein vBVpPvVp04M_00007 [Vibrio phage vB_Vp_PvVp04_M]
MKKEIYYRADMSFSPAGFVVYFHKYIVLHESEAFAWCIPEIYSHRLIKAKNSLPKNKTMLSHFKSLYKVKIKRIHKKQSRFAFSSKEAAYDNLILRKRYQLKKLKQTLSDVDAFLNGIADHEYSNLKRENGEIVVPNTSNYVNKNYWFD